MNFAPLLRARTRVTGAVYTPSFVASALTSHIRGLVRSTEPSILEPSIGDGAFVDPLVRHFPAGNLTGVDIDAQVVEALRVSPVLRYPGTELHASDFIAFARDRINAAGPFFDLAIGNPPFIRRHNFSEDFKGNVAELSKIAEYPLVGLKNSWAAFLVASTLLLNKDGIAAFIIPYELMTVAYGHQILSWLISHFPRIDLFISDQKAFAEIDQDAIIFVGQKRPCVPEGLFVQRVRDMGNLEERGEHALNVDAGGALALELNRFLIPPVAVPLVQRLHRESAKVSDYCTSSPGVVTAANAFFILTEARARELKLFEHTIPILKKGSFASRIPIFGKHDFAEISKREPCRLLHLKRERESLPEPVELYLQEGEKQGFHKRYKCRNRSNWYEVPLVPRVDGFIFKRSHEYPRICLNEAEVFITDTAYGLRLFEGYTMRGFCFSFYNSLTLLFSEIEGRFYGGGVLELSPNEFRGLPLVYHEPTDDEFERFLAAHASGGVKSILDFGDRWLSEKLALNKTEMHLLRDSWLSVRSHRLRHGSAS